MKQGNVTRRNFLAGSAAAAALAGLAGCSAGGAAGEKDAAASLPTADKYPIDPDGSDTSRQSGRARRPATAGRATPTPTAGPSWA